MHFKSFEVQCFCHVLCLMLFDQVLSEHNILCNIELHVHKYLACQTFWINVICKCLADVMQGSEYLMLLQATWFGVYTIVKYQWISTVSNFKVGGSLKPKAVHKATPSTRVFDPTRSPLLVSTSCCLCRSDAVGWRADADRWSKRHAAVGKSWMVTWSL